MCNKAGLKNYLPHVRFGPLVAGRISQGVTATPWRDTAVERSVMRISPFGARSVTLARQHRRKLVLGLALLALVVGVGASVMFGQSSSGAAEPGRTADAVSSGDGAAKGGRAGGEPRPSATPAPSKQPAGVTKLPAAAVGDEVEFGGGLLATVTKIKPVDVTAKGLGETSGPGAAIHLKLRNDSDDPIDLALVSVDVTDVDGTPAIPTRGAPADWLRGELQPGKTALGTYVFRVDGRLAGLEVGVYYAGSPNVVMVRS